MSHQAMSTLSNAASWHPLGSNCITLVQEMTRGSRNQDVVNGLENRPEPLQQAGLPIIEYPQTTTGTTRMGQTLFELLTGRNLRLYAADDLRTHALHTVAIEHPRGWKLAKDKASDPIDAITALSIALVAAIDTPPPTHAPYALVPIDNDPGAPARAT